jgi:hypothetical protein
VDLLWTSDLNGTDVKCSARTRELPGNYPFVVQELWGYVQQLALDISDFQDELDREIALNENIAKTVKERIDKDPDHNESSKEQKDFLQTFLLSTLIPTSRSLLINGTSLHKPWLRLSTLSSWS